MITRNYRYSMEAQVDSAQDPKPAGEGLQPIDSATPRVPHLFRAPLLAFAVAVGWSTFGMGVAGLAGGIKAFLDEWRNLQGFFLIAIGTWLVAIARSGTFARSVAALLARDVQAPRGLTKRLSFAIALTIAVIGTLSLAFMGFRASGPLLGFMLLTCFYVCLVAGFVTVHMIDVLVIIHALEDLPVKVFRYSPARTRELRDVVDYFTWFSLLMTLGYGFALAATFAPNWKGDPTYISIVRLFWPLLYVPLCSLAVLYPHLVVHRLVRREKDSTLMGYQTQIDNLLINYQSLSDDEIGRTNTLASLFDRINSTPDYVLDVGIAVRTGLPLVFNILTLWARPIVEQPRV